MNAEPLRLFDPSAPHARAGDPSTSQRAALTLPRPGTQAFALLCAYYVAGADGLTDREACTYAGIPTGWKRCSDLRRGWLISWDRSTVRTDYTEREQMVCRITANGLDFVRVHFGDTLARIGGYGR